MKKTWLVPCCALGMLLYAGTAHAAFWQILRDTPVRADATVGAKVLGTAKKGWIVSDMTGDGSSPQWIRMVEFQTKSGEGMAYAHFLYKVPDAYISAADVVQVADGDGTPCAPGHGYGLQRRRGRSRPENGPGCLDRGMQCRPRQTGKHGARRGGQGDAGLDR